MAGALDIGSIFVKIGLKDDGFARGMKGAKSSMQEVGAAASQLGGIMSAAITAPMIGFSIAAGRAGIQMDSLKRGLTAVTGSSAETEVQLKRLKEIAKLPGLGMAEAVQGSINLQAAGMSAALAESALTGFGNALATDGKGKADLEGVQMALSQIMSKGVISAEEINQLAERVPQIRKIMESAFGTSNTEQLQKLGISSEEFVRKITVELNKLPKVAGGAQNAWENMTDGIQSALVSMWPTIEPIFTKLTDWVSKAAEWFEKLPGPVKGFGLALAGILAVGGPALLVTGQLVTAWTSILTLGPLLSRSILLIGTSFSTLTKIVRAGRAAWTATWIAMGGPPTWVAVAVAAVGSVVVFMLYRSNKAVKKFLDSVWDGVKWLIGKVSGAFESLFSTGTGTDKASAGLAELNDLINKMAESTTGLEQSMTDLGKGGGIGEILRGMVDNTRDAAASMRRYMKGYVDDVLAEFDRLKDEQKSKYEKMVQAGPAGMEAVVKGVKMFDKKPLTVGNLPGGDALRGMFGRLAATRDAEAEAKREAERRIFGQVSAMPSELDSYANRMQGAPGSLAGATDAALASAQAGSLIRQMKELTAEIKRLNSPLPQS